MYYMSYIYILSFIYLPFYQNNYYECMGGYNFIFLTRAKRASYVSVYGYQLPGGA